MNRIYQFETTNVCNANCNYCPHKSMTRKSGFAEFEVVEAVYDYLKSIDQRYIGLHHMGEPLLHPQINNIVSLFENDGIETEFSTNGMALRNKGESLLETGISRLRIAVDYFYDIPEYRVYLTDFLKIYEKEKVRGCPTEIRIHTIENRDLSIFDGYGAILENKKFDNWAGSVEGESKLVKSNECYFKKYNHVVVLWNGDIVPCCLDYDGVEVLGNILDGKFPELKDDYKLCKDCVNLQFADGGNWYEDMERSRNGRSR